MGLKGKWRKKSLFIFLFQSDSVWSFQQTFWARWSWIPHSEEQIFGLGQCCIHSILWKLLLEIMQQVPKWLPISSQKWRNIRPLWCFFQQHSSQLLLNKTHLLLKTPLLLFRSYAWKQVHQNIGLPLQQVVGSSASVSTCKEAFFQKKVDMLEMASLLSLLLLRRHDRQEEREKAMLF